MKCAMRSEQDALFVTVNTQYLISKVTQMTFSHFPLLDYIFNIMLNLGMSWFWVSFWEVDVKPQSLIH